VLLLVAAGLACLITFVRRRAFHCGITSPALLLGAALLALGPARLWRVPTTVLWPLLVLVIGLVRLCQIDGFPSVLKVIGFEDIVRFDEFLYPASR